MNISDINEAVPENYVYEAFGKRVTLNSFIPRFLYVGQLGYYCDAEYYIRARHYDPSLARWLSEDPIGYRGRKGNLYQYVSGQVTLLSDPDGRIDGSGGGEPPGWCGKPKFGR